MKKVFKTFCLSLTIVFLTFCALLIFGVGVSKKLEVVSYIVRANLSKPLRIVQLTDLHDDGREEAIYSTLLSKVKELNPNMVFLTGDMIQKDCVSVSHLIDFVEELASEVEVYYSFGNHEYQWMDGNGLSLLQKMLTEAGAIVLDTEYVDVGEDLRIGGYQGWYGVYHVRTTSDREGLFEKSFQNTNRYTILLNHVPLQWLDWDYRNDKECEVDLVFCGHYHGGQVRIPILNQGLYAPYVGWLPKYTKGIFDGEYATVILSTGLGSGSKWIPRIYNPPEIVVCDLI